MVQGIMGKTTVRVLHYAQGLFCSTILVFSCALIVVAILLKGTFQKYNAFLYYYGTVMTTYIITGSIISIAIALWGCYCCYKKYTPPSLTIAMGVNFTTHIIISVLYLALLEESLSESVETLFDEQISNYEINPQPMDFTQTSLKCCGKNEASDWFNYLKYIPASCCPNKANNSTTACAILDFPLVNHNGCIRELETYTSPNVQLIIILFIGLLISEFITLLMSIFTCYTLLDNPKVSRTKERSISQISQFQTITHL